MLNQEQYLRDLDDCFNLNRDFLPQTIVMDGGDISINAEKQMALANGEDEVSILSSLTEKTLKEATNRPNNAATNNDELSMISGMTSKSKTQLAVRTALKELSIDHNQAMVKQQQKFQQEIEQLRKLLENTTQNASNQIVTTNRNTDTTAHAQMNIHTPAPSHSYADSDDMDTADSSDDMASISRPRRQAQESSLTVAQAALKRPKRSTSKTQTGKGGLSSSSRKSNV